MEKNFWLVPIIMAILSTLIESLVAWAVYNYVVCYFFTALPFCPFWAMFLVVLALGLIFH